MIEQERNIRPHTTHHTGCGCMIELTYAEYSTLTAKVKRYEDELSGVTGKLDRYEECLLSISKNSCCEQCQEAKFVAIAALNQST